MRNPVRTSEVAALQITNVSLSGFVQIGDHSHYTPTLRALAVQRETDHAQEGSLYFESYPLFSRSLPDVCDYPFFREPQEDSEPTGVERIHHQPCIRVGTISTLGVGASSLLQIGSNCSVQAEARIKHIRQFAIAHPFSPLRPTIPGVNIYPRV